MHELAWLEIPAMTPQWWRQTRVKQVINSRSWWSDESWSINRAWPSVACAAVWRVWGKEPPSPLFRPSRHHMLPQQQITCLLRSRQQRAAGGGRYGQASTPQMAYVWWLNQTTKKTGYRGQLKHWLISLFVKKTDYWFFVEILKLTIFIIT